MQDKAFRALSLAPEPAPPFPSSTAWKEESGQDADLEALLGQRGAEPAG